MRRPITTLHGMQRRQRLAPRVMLVVLMACVVFGTYWFRTRKRLVTDNSPRVAASSAPASTVQSPPAPLPAEPSPPPAVAQATEPTPFGPRAIRVVVSGPLETSLALQAGGVVAPALAQVVSRALVWWLDMPQGLLRGDVVDVLFEPRDGEEPLLYALRLVSQKRASTLRAYRFQAEGDPFARFYEPTGQELEERLANSPIDGYEQITSLIRDGRRHQGIDFKAPVGTPVRAPFHGTLTRRNWKFRANGNCLELTEEASPHRRALFLHLAELPPDARPGKRVRKGDVIAQSGNSGRSYAPHLHYQVMSAQDRVIDPFAKGHNRRRQLDASQLSRLSAAIAELDARLGSLSVAK
ncbi:MAG: M23 family metallopeptidase [Myxococcaceae bacterium]